VHPHDRARLVLRTTWGILLSRDAGVTWDWVCERAVGYGGIEDPSLAILGDGTLLAGHFGGLAVSKDGGCAWQRANVVPTVVVDVTMRPSAPDAAYALADRYARYSDAGELYDAELYASTDDGATWSRRATLDPTLLLESLEVGSGGRMYVSAVRDRARSAAS
jgi:hypothetical protein